LDNLNSTRKINTEQCALGPEHLLALGITIIAINGLKYRYIKVQSKKYKEKLKGEAGSRYAWYKQKSNTQTSG